MDEDIRWKQRFQNFEKAFLQLKDAVEKDSLTELEKTGLIRRFEFAMKISWKVMKDFLEEKGYPSDFSPKGIFHQAQRVGYISYVQMLIDGIVLRSELSHDYSMQKHEEAINEIRLKMFPVLEQLYNFFIQESGNDV